MRDLAKNLGLFSSEIRETSPVSEFFFCIMMDRRGGSFGNAFASHAGDGCSILGRDIPKSFKQVVTGPLPNARQQVRLSRVLGDDHYKRMTRVTVGVAR